MKKLISLILTVSLLLTVCLCGCKKELESVALFNNEGQPNFILIRPADASEKTRELATNFRQRMADNLEIDASFRPDGVAQKEDQLEINIGVTNRPEAQSIYDEIIAANKNNGLDFTIKYSNNVIYIIGASEVALELALEYFYDTFINGEHKSMPLIYDLNYHHSNENNKFSINGLRDLSDFSIVTPQYNMSYLIGRELDDLQFALMTATGSNVKELTDNNTATEYEIVIGNADREGVPEISDSDEYRLSLKDNKLYVAGGSDAAVAVAVKELAAMATNGEPIEANAEIKGSYTETVKKYENYYSMTWSDEFDTLDLETWKPQSGTFTHASYIAEDKRLKMVSDEKSLYVEDGLLHMHASQDANFYNSVELRTMDSVWYKYGFVECSSKFNISSGIATSFWLLGFPGSKHYSELDIFESQGVPNNKIKVTPISHVDGTDSSVNMSVYYCGSITGDQYVDAAYTLPDGENYDDEFHTFGCEWDESHITFTLDGREFLTLNTTVDERAKQTFNGLMQMLLTIYSGVNIGNRAGFPDETTDWENNGFITDYVRLYQLPGQELVLK